MALTQAPEEGLKISNAGTNGQFLQKQSGNTGGLTWATVSTDVVADTSPQLGGDLDVNGNSIVSASNGNIDIDPNGTGDIILQTVTGATTQLNGLGGDVLFGGYFTNGICQWDYSQSQLEFWDSVKASFGSSEDLEIYHDATDNQIKGNNGKIVISTTAGDSDIEITPNGTGDVVIDGLKYPQADGSAGQFLKTDGSAQLSWATVSSPVTALNNATANEIVTVGSTTTELDAEANLTFDGEQLNVTHAGTTDPENQIVLQTSAIDTGGGSGIFLKSSSSTTANRYGSRIHTVREANGASQLVFSTELAGGSTGLQEALKISSNKNVTVSDGDLVIGTSGHGIDFSATADAPGTSASSSSELFANYEKGTWTPAMSSGTVSPSNAIYIRVGDLVWCQATLDSISERSSDTELRVTSASLPFAVDGNHIAAGPVRHRYTSHAGGYSLVAIIDGNGVYFGSSNDATGDKAYTALHYDEIDASYSQIVFSLHYRTNSA